MHGCPGPTMACVLALASGAAAACLPSPQAGCRTPAAGAAQLKLTDRPLDADDRLAWVWARGSETPLDAFGDPVAADGYALCLYDEAGLAFSAGVPPGGDCAGRPCWVPLPAGGFRYRYRAALPEGVEQLLLRAGGDGAAKVVAKGRGAALSGRPLGLPAPPLALPVRVQVQREGGPCWEAVFDEARRNGDGRFVARSAAAPVTTTTTTLPPRPASCAFVVPPPAPCAGDGACPPDYACVDGECRGTTCAVRPDCPADGECVYEGAATTGFCACFGCGAPSCALGCRRGTILGGCRCSLETDCPHEDDVCFLGFCS